MQLSKFLTDVHCDGFTFFPENCHNYGIRAKKVLVTETYEVAIIKKEFDMTTDVVVVTCCEDKLESKLKEAVDLIFALYEFQSKTE